ncbi:hypothetical protein Malapachy_2032 [Malassezia pachydermatis]|uniref:Uncharacterized protein n=1 Tax=Malassezia pachydermatis TaxID=77020 RepID=A0A0M8MSR1_9BASI|nr:hypothetical protein Malapachy_2032 [Malassezia pachydermatis]KOS13594.1 hypothetical protein Malapachy_2032 [Malassezia pachydermatis]
MYRRYMGTAGSSATSIPSVDELADLVRHLQALQQDALTRAQTLADERPGNSGRVSAQGAGTKWKGKDTRVKEEDLEAESLEPNAEGGESSGDEWEPEDSRRRANVNRTYGRQGAWRTKEGPTSDAETEAIDEAQTPVMPRMKMRRAPLSVKLRLTQPDDAARVRSEMRSTPLTENDDVPEQIVDLHGESFTDPTTFSWEVPHEPEATILPKREPLRLPWPYPTHPLDVHEDFADRDWRERESMYTVSDTTAGPSVVPKEAGRGRQTKEASQVSITTFYNYVDTFFKPVTEDDLAWLSSKVDDPSPFQFPELGTHYRQVWDKEDRELQGLLQSGDVSLSSKTRPSTVDEDELPLAQTMPSPFNASSLSLQDMTAEHMYNRLAHGGPLIERLIASLIVPPPSGSPSSSAAALEAATESDLTPPPDIQKPLSDMEAQARQACEAIGLMEPGAPIPWDDQADGPIGSALRLAQARLRRQMKANEERKARLFKVAQDRMAFQDYQACLQAVDREIESSWTKRTRQIKASAGKKRKAEAEAGPSRPQLPETLPEALQRRKKLKAAFEPLFAKIPHAYAPPTESIYHGIEK